MKTIILTVVLSAAAIAFAGCQTATNTANTNANARANTAVVQNSNANSMMNMNGNSMMNGNSNMSGMSGMSDMKSSPNAASQPYDLQFLDTMSAHHQSAIDMAKMVDGKSNNAELKAFGAKIIADQNKEIAQMKNWREKWFAGKPSAMNAEIPGMMDSMRGMNMKKMEAPGGKILDLRFLGMMTQHHQGAITMSKEALDKAEHAEIKTLANQIIKAQEAEIKQMQDWKTAWSQ